MKGPRPEPLFLARDTYRRRRVMDAARVMPFVAAFLFLVPILWKPATVQAMLFLFGAWILLILIGALIARALPFLPPAERGSADIGGDQEAG